MGSELPLGRRISVHPSMNLWLSILIYLQPRLSVAFLLAAAVHELGHVTALSLMGKPPDRLHLSSSRLSGVGTDELGPGPV